MTDDARAALAAALNSPEVVRIVSDEFVASVKESRPLDTLKEATAALAAMPGWHLVPADTSLAYDTGLQDGLLQAAELHRAADVVPVDADLAADGERWRAAEAEGHIVAFDEPGYGLEHPPSCRPNLIGCKYNLWLAEDDEPAMPPGRYRMTIARHKSHEEAEYAALAPATSEP